MDPWQKGYSAAVTRAVLIASGVVGSIVMLILLVFNTIDILLLLFAGILLATFLDGLSNWLYRVVRTPRRWSLCIVILVLGALTTVSIWLLLPRIGEQVHQLQAELPTAVNHVASAIKKAIPMETIMRRMPSLQDLAFGRAGAGLFTQVVGIFSGTFSLIANSVILLFVGLYLAIDPDTYIRGLVALVPVSKRARARRIVTDLGHTLRWWLIGTFADMAVVGVLTGLGLWALGIKLALTLSIFTAILTFIPFIGPVLAAVPALLLAFVETPIKMVYVLILYVVVQMIEGNLTAPLIQQRAVSLPPVLTLIVQIVFGSFFGFLGLILATPLAASILVLVKKIYIEDVLGDTGSAQ